MKSRSVSHTSQRCRLQPLHQCRCSAPASPSRHRETCSTNQSIGIVLSGPTCGPLLAMHQPAMPPAAAVSVPVLSFSVAKSVPCMRECHCAAIRFLRLTGAGLRGPALITVCSGFKKAAIEIRPLNVSGSSGTPWTEPPKNIDDPLLISYLFLPTVNVRVAPSEIIN